MKECPTTSPSGHSASVKDEEIYFDDLCQIFVAIEATTKRLEINEILTGYFKQLLATSIEDEEGCIGGLIEIIHLCLSRLGPAYSGIELGMGETLLMKAIAGATGSSLAKIKQEVEARGDIGLVAEASRSTQRTMFQPKRLTVGYIFKTLLEIAIITGASSMQKKVDRVKALYVACKGNEARYLFRLLEGKLRIGLAEQSVLAALANASAEHVGERPLEADDPVSIIKSVYTSLPDYNIVIPALIRFGIWGLPGHCRLTPGVPLKPMLAFPTKSVTEVLDRFEGLPFTCEFKYDGERAQIHRLESGRVVIFSRNSENMTAKYPDIMAKIGQVTPQSHTYVLDCEVVAYDPKEKRILPFQILSTRKRKDVNVESIQVEVCLFAFDLLYFDGASLIGEPFRRRRQFLHENFVDTPGEFHFARYADSHNTEEIQAFLDEAVKGGCEGLMVKTLEQESSYEPSKRSRKWLKVKKDYLDGLSDSLDLAVIGGYLGRGKRTGVYGGYLLACYDPESEEFQAVCKIGTGFSEADLESQAAFFKDHQIAAPKPYYRCTDGVKPDVWFEPVQIWEVKAADFSISPIYSAAWGLVESGKGISLRFPRFIKIREDKKPEEASTASLLANLYNNQALLQASDQVNFDEEDY